MQRLGWRGPGKLSGDTAESRGCKEGVWGSVATFCGPEFSHPICTYWAGDISWGVLRDIRVTGG